MISARRFLKTHLYVPSAADTGRLPSTALWAGMPEEGTYFFEDFLPAPRGPDASAAAVTGSYGDFAMYAYQGATITDAAEEGGAVILQSDGDNEGVALKSAANGFRITTTSTLALNQKLAFEARIKTSTVAATKSDIFVGLSSALPAAAVPITVTDDALATTQHLIGFHRRGTAAPTEFQACYLLSGGSVVYPTNLTTLIASVTGTAAVADTYYKLGFLFDPDAPVERIVSASTGQTAGTYARPLIKFFVNGVPAGAFLTTVNVQGAAFPTGFMAPSIAILNQTASTPGTLTVDWIAAGQAQYQ
jgi:hypothetical protein